MSQFKALVVDKQGEDVAIELRQLSFDDLPKGEVLIRVHYSGVNYKDSLASIPNGNIVRNYPLCRESIWPASSLHRKIRVFRKAMK